MAWKREGASSKPLLESFDELGLCPTFGRERCARPVIDNLPTALLVTDRRGLVRLANARAASLLQRDVTELMGSLVDKVLAPLAYLRERCAQEERCELEVKLAGSTLVIGYAVAPVGGLLWDEQDEQYAVTFQDITRIAELRDERDRLLSITAISEAIPTLLHELKNPFAAVMSAMEVLGLDAPDEATRESVDAILAQLERMRLVLDGFSLGHRQLRSSRYHRVDRELEQTFRLLRKHAHSSRVASSAEIAAIPPLPLDPVVLRAIAFNLFINAIDACRDGGDVFLGVSLREGDPRPELEMIVADRGHGMDEAVLARCRDVFYTTKSKGSGIGLALCQRAVDAAGGQLEITSAPGEGTTITIRVPCSPYGSDGA